MSDYLQINPQVIGQRLVEARKAARKTQEEAAAHIQCSRPTLIAIEKGTRPAKQQELLKLADFYGQKLHHILRINKPMGSLEPHFRAAIDERHASNEEIEKCITDLQMFADKYFELEQITKSPLSANMPIQVQLPLNIEISQFAEFIANKERARLSLGDQPIINLRQLLDSDLGLRIFFNGMPSKIAGMYAFIPDIGYCIQINSRHPSDRQRWSLAHEYGHFLCDRNKPGIDYLSEFKRKPVNERFADAFASSFLMPETGIRKLFLDIVNSTGDFQVADLCRISSIFCISVQALTRRLEYLTLVPSGTWELLIENGFKPLLLKKELGCNSIIAESKEKWPERYVYLAISAFAKGIISEGQLSDFLQCDRVAARELVHDYITRSMNTDGNDKFWQASFEKSLLRSELEREA
jgi:Zn-dependent peptidase ImmA (M78 family)/DNA-binding XRE family transcriptional regulator